MNATAADGSSVRPILVGIDGSSSALAAARWAARESGIREASIRLVNAFGWMPVHDADDPVQIVPDARDALRRTAEERLAAAAAEVAEVAPDVPVSQEVTTGMPAALLVSLSAEAQLAVVGHLGVGGSSGSSSARSVWRALRPRGLPGRPTAPRRSAATRRGCRARSAPDRRRRAPASSRTRRPAGSGLGGQRLHGRPSGPLRGPRTSRRSPPGSDAPNHSSLSRS